MARARSVRLEVEALRFRAYLQRKFRLTQADWRRMYRYLKRSGILVVLYRKG